MGDDDSFLSNGIGGFNPPGFQRDVVCDGDGDSLDRNVAEPPVRKVVADPLVPALTREGPLERGGELLWSVIDVISIDPTRDTGPCPINVIPQRQGTSAADHQQRTEPKS